MSEGKPTEVNTEQLANIGGGSNFSCEDAIVIIGRLSDAYEGLVDFTSHVMERFIGALNAPKL
jgi:hypothetical protein